MNAKRNEAAMKEIKKLVESMEMFISSRVDAAISALVEYRDERLDETENLLEESLRKYEKSNQPHKVDKIRLLTDEANKKYSGLGTDLYFEFDSLQKETVQKVRAIAASGKSLDGIKGELEEFGRYFEYEVDGITGKHEKRIEEVGRYFDARMLEISFERGRMDREISGRCFTF